MTDRECRDVLKMMRAKLEPAYRYEHRDRDIRALDHAICLLSEQILEAERKHESSMYEQVAKAFGKEE